MYDLIFGDVAGKIGKWDSANIDNHVFRLHYRASFLIFIAGSLLVTSKQYIGDPIDCMSDGIDGGIMDIYCWIHSTFSVPTRLGGVQGVDHAHAGVAPLPIAGEVPTATSDGLQQEPITHHKYYQWVVFVLTLQALLFYVPRLIWKISEGGVMKLLIGDLTDAMAFMDKDACGDGVDRIQKYLEIWRGRARYFLTFFLCEALNLVNVIGQIYFTDRFVGYQFSTYGLDVLTQSEEDLTQRGDAMDKVFPKITKCTFHKYGASGTLERHDALCVLPLNIINEKIYIFLWFWLVALAAVTAVWLLYRLCTMFVLKLRVSTISARCGGLIHKDRIVAALTIEDHNYFQQLGDYLLLYFITKNLSPMIMKDVFDAIVPEEHPIVEAKKSIKV